MEHLLTLIVFLDTLVLQSADMPKIISNVTPYLNQPCERCGSKKRISKTWTEKLPTLTGTTIVKHSQIVCTSEICQAEFDKQLLEERKKREAMRFNKETKEAKSKAKKNKSGT